ncbi:geraniol 8-hydroxylase-like [Iris pallida]|uniref:Geraniol 8-hydroxylase-like n=1 Tax=Iris pallida TaxID=29817 RepID=A0AAX6GEG4_IRIPA|nr:geraniol 8-hydroxylase-like [Iris pallida]
MELQISSTSNAFLLYVSAAVFAVVWYALFSRWRHNRVSPPLPPGPTGLPLVGSLPFVDLELHSYLGRLARTYGPIYLIKIGQMVGVVITSPALAREVLRDHDNTMANHEPLATAKVITYGGNDIVWAPNGPTWRMLRRVCVHEVLSPMSLDAVYHLRRREVRAAVGELYANAAAAKAAAVVDVGPMVLQTILNVLMGMLWGATIEEEERGHIGREFREVIEEIVEQLGQPNIGDFFPALVRFDLQGLQAKMGKLLDRFDVMFTSIIDRKKKMEAAAAAAGKKEAAAGKDFLHFLLKLEAEGGDSKAPFTMTHVKALLVDMVLGGSDTTANTIEWAMAETIANPEIMRRVQEELDQVVGKGNVLEESHMTKLHYLGAVVKEVLRLHPPFPILVPHTPSSPCVVGGYTVPQGSRVIFNAWAIHRDPSIWEDPLVFKPERFLDTGNGGIEFNGKDFSYLPFGSGRRICAGIPLAERMTTLLLGSLLHSFDWKVPEGTKLDLSEKFGIVLKMTKPLVAIPTPRLPNPEQYAQT